VKSKLWNRYNKQGSERKKEGMIRQKKTTAEEGKKGYILKKSWSLKKSGIARVRREGKREILGHLKDEARCTLGLKKG